MPYRVQNLLVGPDQPLRVQLEVPAGGLGGTVELRSAVGE